MGLDYDLITNYRDKKKLLACHIKQQHKILTEGCGAKKCRDENCVSSGT